MDAFKLVRSMDAVMDSLNKTYPQKTGFLLAVLSCLMNRIEFQHPDIYADVEKYIEKAKADMIADEQEKLNVAA